MAGKWDFLLITYLLLLELNPSGPAALGARNPTELLQATYPLPVTMCYLVQEQAATQRVDCEKHFSFRFLCHSLHYRWRIYWILSHVRKGGEGLRRLLRQGKGKARFYLTFMLVNKSYLVSLGWCIKVIKWRHGFLLLGIQRLNFTLVRNFWQECKRPETAERAHMFSETIAFCCCLTCDEFWKLMERMIEIGVYVYVAAMDRWGGLVL